MKKYTLKGSDKVWSKEEIVQEGLEVREIMRAEGIEDTDILNAIIGREDVVEKRLREELGLFGFDLEMEMWRVKEWYKFFILLEGWEEVLEDNVYKMIATETWRGREVETVSVENGVLEWGGIRHGIWFSTEYGIATQKKLEMVIEEVENRIKEVQRQMNLVLKELVDRVNGVMGEEEYTIFIDKEKKPNRLGYFED